jgi:hypothetical protein
MEGQATVVAGHQNESRTAHVALNTQTEGNALREASLACPKLTRQQNNVSSRRLLPNNATEVLGELRAV